MTVSKEEIMERFRENMKINSELKQAVNFCKENAKRLRQENEQLKQELWDISIDYFTETYSDNSIRRDEHINEFKKEFKAKYGDVE